MYSSLLMHSTLRLPTAVAEFCSFISFIYHHSHCDRLTGAHVAAAVTGAGAPCPRGLGGHHRHHLRRLLLDHWDLHEMLLAGHDVYRTQEQTVTHTHVNTRELLNE